MNKLIVLAAFALAAGTVGSQACDYQRNAANATPVIVATSEQPTAQQPAAAPAPTAPKITCDGSGCATEEPANLGPPVLACNGSDC